MNKIIQLDESTIHQIAAGEVVENPASIVKELLENSLDAGATHISITIRSGGKALIEIEDNGCGMSREDAPLSLQRYATSKLRTSEDLFSLKTMGFRGEAMAAISAVSEFVLKTSNGQVGTKIQGKGGSIEIIEPCARNRGTTVSIMSLFFNVPARQKFQKSSSASLAAITKVVQMIAAAHPEVAFSYYNETESLLSLPIQSWKERVEAVFGLFALEGQGAMGWGLFHDPMDAKPRRTQQYIFMNRRPIVSPLLSRAVQAGYHTRLREHTYPGFVLFLEMDPDQVDVNVHPQKREVRFANEQALFSKVKDFVNALFVKEPVIHAEEAFFERPALFSLNEELPRVREAMVQEALPWEMKEQILFIRSRYCLMEKEDLILIDLVALHARLLFDQLHQKQIQMTPLLFPLEVDTDDPEDVVALQKMHIESRLIGPRRLAIDALPSLMEPSAFFSFFTAWKEGRQLDRAALSYCKALRKRYSFEEVIDLWRKLSVSKESLYDPIGRKIWKKIEQVDLEQWMSQGLVKSKHG